MQCSQLLLTPTGKNDKKVHCSIRLINIFCRELLDQLTGVFLAVIRWLAQISYFIGSPNPAGIAIMIIKASSE